MRRPCPGRPDERAEQDAGLRDHPEARRHSSEGTHADLVDEHRARRRTVKAHAHGPQIVRIHLQRHFDRLQDRFPRVRVARAIQRLRLQILDVHGRRDARQCTPVVAAGASGGILHFNREGERRIDSIGVRFARPSVSACLVERVFQAPHPRRPVIAARAFRRRCDLEAEYAPAAVRHDLRGSGISRRTWARCRRAIRAPQRRRCPEGARRDASAPLHATARDPLAEMRTPARLALVTSMSSSISATGTKLASV